MVCGLSVSAESKWKLHEILSEYKEWKKKKLLVEWKIGTFGVYNLTTTTNRREKNRKRRIEGRKKSSAEWERTASSSRSALDVMICLTNSCTRIQKLWSTRNHWFEPWSRERWKQRKEDCNYPRFHAVSHSLGKFLKHPGGQSSLMATRERERVTSCVMSVCTCVQCSLPPTITSLSEFIKVRAHNSAWKWIADMCREK
jgi:hypothetical protein